MRAPGAPDAVFVNIVPSVDQNRESGGTPAAPPGRVTAVLAGFYFCVFAYIGVLTPWYPPLLESMGLGPGLLGLALFAIQAPRAILPPLWGLVADRVAEPRRILAITALLAAVAFSATSAPLDYGPLVLLLIVHGVLVVPVFPLAEMLTFRALAGRRERYGRIRAWGSLGFIVAALGMGAVVDRLGLDAVPLVIAFSLGLAGIVALALPRGPVAAPRPTGSARGRLPWASFLPLLVAAALGQASHGVYYAFYTIQLGHRGYDGTTVGALWALAVVAEIAMMALSPRLLGVLRPVTALRIALAASALRWGISALPLPLAGLALVQILHAATFALLHMTTVQLADVLSPEGTKALGQTFVSMAAYGIGVGGGIALAGALAAPLGDAGLYVCFAGLALLGLLATARLRG